MKKKLWAVLVAFVALTVFATSAFAAVRWRNVASDTEIEDLDLSKSDVNVETIVLDKIDYENMLLLVQSMDEKYKTPLLLKVQGYKVSEIADFLNISPGNVKVRLHRARKIILTGLEENGNE